MKRILTFCLFTFFAFQLSAQSGLDNLGFENWSEDNVLGNSQPNGLGSVGQTENNTDPIEGNSALSLTTKKVQTGLNEVDTLGVTLLGDITFNGVTLGQDYTECPDSITGYIRYDLPNQDSGVVAARVWNGSDTASADTLVGGKLGSWTSFKIPFQPMDCGGTTPDSIVLFFSSEAVLPEANLDIGTQTPGKGSFELDGVKIWVNGISTDVSELADQETEFGVRPNPAQEKVRFEYGSKAERIRIFDMTGRNVRNVQLRQSDQQMVDVSEMDEGLYIYRLEDPNGRALHSEKLQVIR